MTAAPIPQDDAQALLDFLQRAGALKDTLRSGFSDLGRPESTAEHSWRLMLWVEVLADAVPELDRLKLMRLALVHDLAEAVSGDIPAPQQDSVSGKSDQERQDLTALTAGLPKPQRRAIQSLWEEYEAAQSPEAVLIKGLDKLETILQHCQGENPPDFDYGFNLDYGQAQTARHPLTAQLRPLLDRKTRARMSTNGKATE